MCSRSVVQLHEATQIFVVMDYVKEMTVKKSYKCGEYGLLNSCSFQLFLAFVFGFFVLFCFCFHFIEAATDFKRALDL